MCDPLAGAAIAATAGGALLQGMGAQQAANASNRARQASDAAYAAKVNQERQRQAQFADQKYNELDKTVNNMDVNNQNAQQQKIRGDLSTQYQNSAAIDPNAKIAGLNSNNAGAGDPGGKVINSTFQDFGNKTNNYLKSQADAKAGIDAWGNSNLANQLFTQNQGNNIGVLQNLQGGSNNALQTELGFENMKAQRNQYNAQSAGSGLSMFGSLLGGLGGMGSKFAHF